MTKPSNDAKIKKGSKQRSKLKSFASEKKWISKRRKCLKTWRKTNSETA